MTNPTLPEHFQLTFVKDVAVYGYFRWPPGLPKQGCPLTKWEMRKMWRDAHMDHIAQCRLQDWRAQGKAGFPPRQTPPDEI